MAMVSVRYIVDDVDAAINFYTQRLSFAVDAHPGPGFAILSRDGLRLLLNTATGPSGAAQPMQTGGSPRRAAGTASNSRSPTSTERWRPCARPIADSATPS